MNILFAADENSWGRFFELIRSELPQHHFKATGRFGVDSLEGVDVLIPTMMRVTREVLRSADRLKLIQQCGAGLEGVDMDAAWERGIQVANVPTDVSGNADSVAELGIYMMIGLSRDVRQIEENLTEGRMGVPRGKALLGKTVGLVGLGGIGCALARRLKPFGVRLIGIRRHQSRGDEKLGFQWVGGAEELGHLLANSDYVVLCVPVSDETRCLMSYEAFSQMKQDAFLINLARGGLVDRAALEDALANGKIAGAGLDVFWDEPPDSNDPVFRYNVLATPHIGGATDVSIRGILKAVAENILRLERNENLLYLKTPGR